MKTLATNLRNGYASEMLIHTVDGRDTRFKVVVEYGNSYSRLHILIQTLNLDFKEFANEYDIEGYEPMSYVVELSRNRPIMLKNIELAKNYIKKCF